MKKNTNEKTKKPHPTATRGRSLLDGFKHRLVQALLFRSPSFASVSKQDIWEYFVNFLLFLTLIAGHVMFSRESRIRQVAVNPCIVQYTIHYCCLMINTPNAMNKVRNN